VLGGGRLGRFVGKKLNAKKKKKKHLKTKKKNKQKKKKNSLTMDSDSDSAAGAGSSDEEDDDGGAPGTNTTAFYIIEMTSEALKLAPPHHPCHGAGLTTMSRLLSTTMAKTTPSELTGVIDVLFESTKSMKRCLARREVIRGRRLMVVGEIFSRCDVFDIRKAVERRLVEMLLPSLSSDSVYLREVGVGILPIVFRNFPQKVSQIFKYQNYF